MAHDLDPRIHASGSGQRIVGAGGDALTIRLETQGADPITVIEDESSDTEPAPVHSHPWDELIYVLAGEMSLTCGDQTAVGGPGTLATLPSGVPHTLHVTKPPARFLMITIGAPSAGFLKDIGRVYAEGPSLERLIEVARQHGVVPHF